MSFVSFKQISYRYLALAREVYYNILIIWINKIKMEVAKKYIDLADRVLWRIGYKNIVFGGVVGAAFLAQ